MLSVIRHFIKNETVLFVSFVLALASCFVVHPDKTYISYIDFRTLGILLSLMITMAGLQKLSVFRQLGELLASKMSSVRGVVLILTGLCFFSSMLITNDVALITFVPFSIVTLSVSGHKELYIIVIVLETVAANLGSMLTPLGNPQNLYLYSLSELSLSDFVLLMLPYSIAAAVLLTVFALIGIKNTPVTHGDKHKYERSRKSRLLIIMYVFTFVISILVVARLIPYYIGLVVVVALTLIFDRHILAKPDYSLLFTFIFLFIFIGNIKRVPMLSDALGEFVKVNEVGVSVFLSQFISNVPAAILCSGFTDDIPKLIVGTNIGGLGTLIASMASLISFKQYSYTKEADIKKYLIVFTVINLIFLIMMFVVRTVTIL